ncbi:MAG: molybdenum ABC transporter ATP-binding protein, partial [Oscillospiraceae bacterium]|nr:molybdenum ABC transporter ATP-binding protein [Oscillospiraceae bacterium]
VAAEKTGDHEVRVPEWGVRLQTAQPVRDGLVAIGIRAHYFNVSTKQNRFPVSYVEEMEEPFEVILQFRYAGQRPDSQPVWWRLAKGDRPQQFPEALGIAPANILLLYDE